MSTRTELERWYDSQCNEDWEHAWGVTIGTLDNPGWDVRIDLDGTYLEDVPFEPIRDTEPEREWMLCEVSDRTFEGYGGPSQLEQILRTFLEWAQQHEDTRPPEHEAAEPTAASRQHAPAVVPPTLSMKTHVSLLSVPVRNALKATDFSQSCWLTEPVSRLDEAWPRPCHSARAQARPVVH